MGTVSLCSELVGALKSQFGVTNDMEWQFLKRKCEKNWKIYLIIRNAIKDKSGPFMQAFRLMWFGCVFLLRLKKVDHLTFYGMGKVFRCPNSLFRSMISRFWFYFFFRWKKGHSNNPDFGLQFFNKRRYLAVKSMLHFTFTLSLRTILLAYW